MYNADLVNFIAHRLVNKLLKSSAHFRMMPSQRRTELVSEEQISHAIPSAVMLLLFENDKRIQFIVTKRQSYNGVHSGQISLPGGKVEQNDESIQQTALRETFEEIGIQTSEIKVIGQLSPLYIPPSNFIVYPFIGLLLSSPVFTKNEKEVDKIIEINLADLLNEANVKEKIFEAKNYKIPAPYYELGDAQIWGATAMILSEFKEIVKDFYQT